MPEIIVLFFEDKHSKLLSLLGFTSDFGGLDLQYRAPEIGLPSCEIKKDNFIDSKGKQIRTEKKESCESKVLKQKQHCVAVAVAVMIS